jgi:hypothetical protein
MIGTSLLMPTLRITHGVSRTAFATLGPLHPGRVFPGLDSGKATNETPATGQELLAPEEWRIRLAEVIEPVRPHGAVAVCTSPFGALDVCSAVANLAQLDYLLGSRLRLSAGKHRAFSEGQDGDCCPGRRRDP